MDKVSTVNRYAIALIDKNTNTIKYVKGEAAPSYIVKDGVKYKKKNFSTVSDANNAFLSSSEESANKYRDYILEYRGDLLKSFTVELKKVEVKTAKLSQNEIKLTFINFVDKLNDLYYYHGDNNKLIDYLYNSDNLAKLNEVAARLRHMNLPKEE